MYLKKLILFVFIVISFNASPMGFVESLKKSALQKNVWVPASSALLFSLTGYDGEFSDWASEKKPLFGSVSRAKSYSDAMTFYYFPAANMISKGVQHYYGFRHENLLYHYTSFILAPALTFLFNRELKDRSGRIRPDGSNDLSFPSSHTGIASSFNEEFWYANAHTSPRTLGHSIYYVNEGIVSTVALARLEAKKHHLTDVLVGYSLGKFFSHFFHYYLFSDFQSSSTTINIHPSSSSLKVSWSL